MNGAIATLTQHRGSLAGTLLDETGGPVPGAAVLVYPIDERYRGLSAQRIRYVVSAPFGDYTATGLRPGHSRVATLVGVELGAWDDAEVLREIDATAVPFRRQGTIVDGPRPRATWPRHRAHDPDPGLSPKGIYQQSRQRREADLGVEGGTGTATTYGGPGNLRPSRPRQPRDAFWISALRPQLRRQTPHL